MNKILAIVEMTDAQVAATPEQMTKVQVLRHFPQINADSFLSDWNEGIVARRMWESFVGGLFSILTENELLDENGLHFNDYSFGDVCKYIVDNQDKLPSPIKEATSSTFGMVLMSSIKTASRTIRRKKEIKIDFPEMQKHLMPMLESIMVMAMKDPDRAKLLTPLLNIQKR